MSETKEVSQETKAQMEAVKQLVNVFDLLQLGTYQATFAKRLHEAQSFIKGLHEQAFKSLQDAPDYEQLILEGSDKHEKK